MFPQIEGAVCGDGIGDTLDRDLSLLHAVDALANMRVGLVGQQDLSRLGSGLEPGCEVHATADDGIVHPVLAAEVADGAEARVDADPALERSLNAGCAPDSLQGRHAF